MPVANARKVFKKSLKFFCFCFGTINNNQFEKYFLGLKKKKIELQNNLIQNSI